MKIFAVLFFLSGLTTFAQGDGDPVTAIRKIVAQINKDSGYTVKKLDGEDFLEETTDNGATLTGYFKNGKLVKMIEWMGLSSCINITEYYLQNDQLVFAYTRGSETLYIDSLQSFDQTKQKVTMECRFYFDRGKMIKMIASGSTRCGGPPARDWANNYVEECKRFKNILITK